MKTVYIAVCVILIAFKLADIGIVAQWSWWAVLAPILLPIALVSLLIVLAFACFVIASNMEEKR